MKKINFKGAIKHYLKNIKSFTWWRILTYFIIYSVLGFIIETFYGVISKGLLESRQSFLYGPFCGIYGVGAVIMIVLLNPFKRNNNKLFWGGFLVGSVTEYIIGLFAELIFKVKWWDYSNMPLNIGGKVCAYFSIFWGLLGIYLVSYVNPKVDKFINFLAKKINKKILKTIQTLVAIFILFDILITVYGLKVFYVRTIKEHNIDVSNKAEVEEQYNRIYSSEFKTNIVNTLFSNKKMVRTFPNLKLEDKNGNIIYFDSLNKDVQPYYYKLFTPKKK